MKELNYNFIFEYSFLILLLFNYINLKINGNPVLKTLRRVLQASLSSLSTKLVKITVYNTNSVDFPRRQCTINYRKFREVKQNHYRYHVSKPTLL